MVQIQAPIDWAFEKVLLELTPNYYVTTLRAFVFKTITLEI